ncbi:hypothetical protein [Nakamurella leprariae]|uniref:EthD domain-containing protein n=1 Tax=Nakamurella leprariae TaxID=2803911 RepID=A0A938Y7K0_9ACTN|nr:hypothetical protein [Nakamurella leprariae]MBM9467491.1 hypothetical protein [Nakamurella leprariae]
MASHTIAAARGFVEPLDGLTEVWIANPAARAEPTDESRHAGEAMAEDERRFVQMDQSRCFMTKEHVIFDHTS